MLLKHMEELLDELKAIEERNDIENFQHLFEKVELDYTLQPKWDRERKTQALLIDSRGKRGSVDFHGVSYVVFEFDNNGQFLGLEASE